MIYARTSPQEPTCKSTHTHTHIAATCLALHQLGFLVRFQMTLPKLSHLHVNEHHVTRLCHAGCEELADLQKYTKMYPMPRQFRISHYLPHGITALYLVHLWEYWVIFSMLTVITAVSTVFLCSSLTCQSLAQFNTEHVLLLLVVHCNYVMSLPCAVIMAMKLGNFSQISEPDWYLRPTLGITLSEYHLHIHYLSDNECS